MNSTPDPGRDSPPHRDADPHRGTDPRPDADPQRDAVRRLAALLADLSGADGPAPTGRELADLLWLRDRMGGGTPRRPAEADRPSVKLHRPTGAHHHPAPTQGPNALPPQRSSDPARRRPLHLPGPAPTADVPPLPASPVRVGTDRVLPRRRELARALRPLKRGVPSTDRTALDEEATAERLARDPRWWPVLVPAVDRWLGARLIVDAHGDSAVLWEPLARELSTLLADSGIFRDVRLHRLTGPDAPDDDTAAPPTGRTATFVLTDGVHPDWAGPRLRAALRRWAQAGPTAVLQTLPEHLWSQTELAPEPGRFRTAAPADPSPRFTPYALLPPPQPPGTLAVPVLGLTPEWLAPWARATAGPSAYDAPAVLLAPDRLPKPSDLSGPAVPSTPAESLGAGRLPLPTGDFDSFLAQSQPRVFRLAALLSAVPLNFGVMRLVQSALLPDSPPADLAEIVFSGLLHAVPDDPSTEPLGRAYEFAPGVRERLLATLRRDEAQQVVDTVSEHLATHAAALHSRFTAVFPDPDGPLTLPATARPWAHTAAPTAPAPPTPPTPPATVPGRRFFLPIVGVAVPGEGEPDATSLFAGATQLATAFHRLGYRQAELTCDQPAGPTDDRSTSDRSAMDLLRAWAEQVGLGPDDLVTVYLAGHSMAAFGQQAELLLPDGLSATRRRQVRRVALEEFRRAFGRLGRLLLIVDQHPLRTGPSAPPPGRPALTLLVRGPLSGPRFPQHLADWLTALATGTAAPPATGLDLLEHLHIGDLAPADATQNLLPFFTPEPRPAENQLPEPRPTKTQPAEARLPEPHPAEAPRPEPTHLLDALVSWLTGDRHDTAPREFYNTTRLPLPTVLRCLGPLTGGIHAVVVPAQSPRPGRLWEEFRDQLGLQHLDREAVLAHLAERRASLLLVLTSRRPSAELPFHDDEFLRTLTRTGVRVLLVDPFATPTPGAVRLRPGRDESLICDAVDGGQRLEPTDPARAADVYRLALDLALTAGSRCWQAVATTALDRLGAPHSTPRPTQLDRVQAAFTTAPGAADALLDLSGLIRTGLIGTGPADLVGQVYATLRALITHRGDPATGLHAVVDPAALDTLHGPDLAAVRDWIDNDLIETAEPHGDRLLELATILDVPVISPDPLPAGHPLNLWVTRLAPHPEACGTVRLEPQPPATPRPAFADFSYLLQHNWRCPTEGCTRYAPIFEPPPLPSIEGLDIICTQHRTRLTPTGPRPAVAHFKAVTERFCSAQFSVDEGSSFPLSLSVDSTPLVLSFRDGTVTVLATDIGARYRLPGPDSGPDSGSWQDLTPDRPLPAPPGTRVAPSMLTTLVRTGTPLPGEPAPPTSS
ncbi:SAV_2336 N-terminal domain-related protein [Kitasatospora cineracea]|uniref:SAV_2336 N-terminal domain-related protein n=1 Tax=Kitasatospora cineracea TaxID=88074 RepID=UPI0038126D31